MPTCFMADFHLSAHHTPLRFVRAMQLRPLSEVICGEAKGGFLVASEHAARCVCKVVERSALETHD